MHILEIKNRHNIEWLIFTCFISVGFVFRLFLMRYHFAIGWDEPHYLQLAVLFSRGQFIQALHPYWSPMYSICVAIFSFIIPNFETAGRIVSLISGLLIFFPVYLFARELFGKVSGFWSIGLLTFFSPLAFNTTTALTEPVFIFFIIMSIYFGWEVLKNGSFKNSIATGIFFGFSYLTKPEGIGYFLIFIVFIGIYTIIDLIKLKKSRLFSLIFCIICFVFISMPYLFYLHNETGRWTISSKIYANQQFEAQAFNNDEINFISLSSDNTIHPFDAIYHDGNFLNIVDENQQQTSSIHILLILKKYITNFYRITKYTIPQLFGFVMFILLILGLFSFKSGQKKVKIHFYLLSFIVLFWFVAIPLFHINERYLLPGLVICFIWIGHGANELTVWVNQLIHTWINKKTVISEKIRTTGFATFSVIIFIILFCLIPEFGKIISRDKYSPEIWENPIELKRAGLWLKEHVSHEPILMSFNKSVDYYAGSYDVRKGTSFSDNRFDRVLVYANHRNVEYMVVSERYLVTFPNLAFLFNDEDIPDVLDLIYDEKVNEGLGVRIFQLKSGLKVNE